MSEQKPTGLSPNFNLEDSLAEADEQAELHSVAAADNVRGELTTDPKTGLANEKAWFGGFSAAVESLQPGDRLQAYVADLDKFKAVNDKYGHQAGDELLAIAGESFRQAFARSTDYLGHGSRDYEGPSPIARLGGDEFSAYSVNRVSDNNPQRTATAEEEALIQANKVNEIFQQSIAGTKFDGMGVKLSIGSAEHQAGEEPEDTFARADLAMFQVKYTGKIEALTDEDKDQLRRIIPYLESKGARVESWLKVGAGLAE